MNIDEKIGKIEPKIKEPSFLENKGLSNEVGYYIFDYDPKYELKVREEVSRLTKLSLKMVNMLNLNMVLEELLKFLMKML